MRATSFRALVVVLCAPIAMLTMAPGIFTTGQQDGTGHTDRPCDRFPELPGLGLLAVGSEEVLGVTFAGGVAHPLLLRPSGQQAHDGLRSACAFFHLLQYSRR